MTNPESPTPTPVHPAAVSKPRGSRACKRARNRQVGRRDCCWGFRFFLGHGDAPPDVFVPVVEVDVEKQLARADRELEAGAASISMGGWSSAIFARTPPPCRE